MDYISQFDSEEEFIEYSRSLFKKRQEIFAWYIKFSIYL